MSDYFISDITDYETKHETVNVHLFYTYDFNRNQMSIRQNFKAQSFVMNF